VAHDQEDDPERDQEDDQIEAVEDPDDDPCLEGKS
jgi:hypothetical protein